MTYVIVHDEPETVEARKHVANRALQVALAAAKRQNDFHDTPRCPDVDRDQTIAAQACA